MYLLKGGGNGGVRSEEGYGFVARVGEELAGGRGYEEGW